MKKNAQLRPLTQTEIQSVVHSLNNGQVNQAETQAKKLLKLHPNAFALWNLYGNALASQQKLREAVDAFRKALKLEPNIAEMHFNLGALLSQMNRAEEAITSYRKAVKLKPDMVDAHYNLALACQALRHYDAAATSYEKALALEPGFYEAMANYGVVLQEQGKLEEAIQAYLRALAIHPAAQTFYNLGTAYKNQGKLAKAVEAYHAALKLNPDYADALSNMGEVLRDQGRYDESVKAYQQALQINPDLPLANYSLAVYLYDSGDLQGALKHFQRSQHADWQERSLYCLYKTQQFDAFKLGLDALKRSKDNSPFLATLAGHYAENFGSENDYNFCKNPLDFVFHTDIAELKNDPAFVQQLLQDIDTCDVDEKSQGRLYNGVQSSGNLFNRSEDSFRRLAGCVAAAVERYRQTFAGENCQFVKAFPKQTVFASSWYVRMKTGGHLTSHIHEEGWVSGSLYLSLPKNKQHPHEGSIELSTHGDDYPKQHDNFPTKTIAPEVGDLVMFPSSVFHRTIPFSSDEQRICIAFDLKPA